MNGTSPPPGFDFTGHMRRLCADLSARLDDFRHIDMSRVAVRICQTRRRGPAGTQASLTPLRFENGAVETTRRGRRYRVQALRDELGQEMLYLLSFYLPRFLDPPFAEKLATACHELWHISPQFNGDIRRHGSRCYAHGPDETAYHAQMRRLAARYLALDPPESCYGFLRSNFRRLDREHGGIWGTRFPNPRLIPVASDGADR